MTANPSTPNQTDTVRLTLSAGQTLELTRPDAVNLAHQIVTGLYGEERARAREMFDRLGFARNEHMHSGQTLTQG